MGKSKGGRPRSIEATMKAQKGADMRIAGATWAQIADECGYATPSGARTAVMRLLDRVTKETGQKLHPIVNGRAELLWRKAWGRVNRAGTVDEWDRAMRQAMNAVALQARINGLMDQKLTLEVTPDQESVADLQKQFRELTLIEGGASDQPELESADAVDAEIVDEEERKEM